jgi:hypothetical protein
MFCISAAPLPQAVLAQLSGAACCTQQILIMYCCCCSRSTAVSTAQNLATLFNHVNTINQNNPSGPRLFPKAALAVTAASDNALVKLDVNTLIQSAAAMGQHNSFAEISPASVLLLPTGQSTGAVADVVGVTFDSKTSMIALELELVHQPHTISEFQPHGKQSLDVEEAHYHFETAPGVNVDAQAFLNNLQSAGFAPEGGSVQTLRGHVAAAMSHNGATVRST